MSVISTIKKRNAELHYTKQDAYDAIQRMTVGFSMDLAAKYPATIKSMVQEQQYTMFKNENGGKLNEVAFGRNLFESIKTCLKLGGDCLEKIVLSNFDLNEFLTIRQESRTKLDVDIKKIESNLLFGETDKPDREFFTFEADTKIHRKRQTLHENYLRKFEERIFKRQVEVDQDVQHLEQLASGVSSAPSAVPQSAFILSQSRRQRTTTTNRRATTPTTTNQASTTANEETEANQKRENNQSSPLRVENERFTESIEYAEFDAEITAYQEDQLRKATQAFYEELKLFRENKQKLVQDRIQLEQLKTERQQEVIVEIVGTGIHGAIAMIIAKVKTALQDCPNVRVKLQGRVQVPSGEAVIDPLGSSNLCGIYYALYKEYIKASMGTFFTCIMELLNMSMNESVSRDRPEIAVMEANKQLKIWLQLDLYDYMDMDKLFTLSLLISYHKDSELRQRATMELINYIDRKYDGNIIIHDGDSVFDEDEDKHNMPLYTFLTNYISVYVKSKAMCNNKDSRDRRNNNNNNPRTNTLTNTSRGGGYENANAASTSNEAKGPYENFITREDNLWHTDIASGKRFLYLATTLPCQKCSDKKNPAKFCSKPTCYIGQCKKCFLYGHKTHDCRQVGATTDQKQNGTQKH